MLNVILAALPGAGAAEIAGRRRQKHPRNRYNVVQACADWSEAATSTQCQCSYCFRCTNLGAENEKVDCRADAYHAAGKAALAGMLGEDFLLGAPSATRQSLAPDRAMRAIAATASGPSGSKSRDGAWAPAMSNRPSVWSPSLHTASAQHPQISRKEKRTIAHRQRPRPAA